jgi:serine/threonine protein kinase
VTLPTDEFLQLQDALAGEYSLQRELGRGGMGVVYLARDVQLDRDVAIKILPLHLARIEEFRERFLREARTAAGLSHPNIVPIHRVGEAKGFVFFVMSYIEGETLGERLRTRGPLPPSDAARILREVAWALAYAHGRGIVHRDVKPDNIMLEAAGGRAIVMDFGIAHGGGQPGSSLDDERIMGTANFMSPEQAANDRIDGRSDIYSLGVVGYVALSGRLPFDEPNLPALLSRQANDTPVSVARVSPGVPPAIAAAIDRCLALDPELRFPDAEALAAELAPPPDTRHTLQPALRAWLAARNPLLMPYMAWSAGLSMLTVGNFFALMTGNPGSSPSDVFLLIAGTASPLLPIVGYHINQAHRQFRSGYSLADLRTALASARRERMEAETLSLEQEEPAIHRVMRLATLASTAWLGVTFGLMVYRLVPEVFFVPPMLTTMLLGAISNALDVQFIPRKVRQWFQTGIRDRLWNSRAGEWIARRLGAPERSRAVTDGAFRATEVALGAAAADLFAALPETYRDQLHELPATVAALEAHAAAARAEIEVVAALVPSGSENAAMLESRRSSAAAHLGQSVAALEKIRLDLLRLHGGATDLSPLTTLIDSARTLDDEIRRLAEAEKEVDAILKTG